MTRYILSIGLRKIYGNSNAEIEGYKTILYVNFLARKEFHNVYFKEKLPFYLTHKPESFSLNVACLCMYP